jgi:hypothetical protein
VVTVAHVLENSALLKLELMRRGLRVPPAVLERLRPEAHVAASHAVFGNAWDLDVVLPGAVWAAVPVHPRLVSSSPYALLDGEPELRISSSETPDVSVPVKVRPTSAFFSGATRAGVPYGRIGTVHGPYLALSPTNRCQFLASDDRCRFCGVGDHGLHDLVPVPDIIDAVRVARAEHRVDMVHLSIGHVGGEDGGVRLLEPYVHALKKHFDVLVAVDALPPASDGWRGWIDRTYGMGADLLSYNLEIFDPARFERICKGPARVVGRQRFLDALAYATTVFPAGAVVCHLIVGLEPFASTLEGMRTLIDLGVVPVLPVYRPFKGRDLRAEPDVERFEPTLADLAELYSELWRRAKQRKLPLGLVRDIATVTTPIESRFFEAERPNLLARMANALAGSRFGRRTSARMSDLRRALRVRDVSLTEP